MVVKIMKKCILLLLILGAGFLFIGRFRTVKGDSSEVSPPAHPLSENRTIRILVKLAKEDYHSVLQRLSHFEDHNPIIAYGDKGAIIGSSSETKETFFVEDWSEDGKTLRFRDDDPVTVAEVKEAIKPYAPKGE